VKIISKKLFFFFVAFLTFIVIMVIIAMQPHLTDSISNSSSGNYADNSQPLNQTGIQKQVSILSVSQQTGDGNIRISGRTDLPAGSVILYEIWPDTIFQREKAAEEIYGSAGTTTSYEQNGSIIWSVNADAGSWDMGGYIVNAWPQKTDPRFGDRKKFFLPVIDTILNGAGKDSGKGEILLIPLSPSGTAGNGVSVTPLPTP
jgi:hypothetical protein